MERIQISKNFWLDEYIPEALYMLYKGKPHLLLRMIDVRLVKSDQKLRTLFGPITINNWWHEGSRNHSGIRALDSPYYSITSDHAWGRASDKIFKDVTAEEVREFIKIDYQNFLITVIEEEKDAPEDEDIKWVHSAISWHTGNGLLLVHPNGSTTLLT